MGDRRSRRSAATLAATVATSALVGLAGGTGGSPAAAATTTSATVTTSSPVTTSRPATSTTSPPATTSAGLPATVNIDFEDGSTAGWYGAGLTTSVVTDGSRAMRVDGLTRYDQGVGIPVAYSEADGSWFHGRVRLKLPAGAPSTTYQVFTGEGDLAVSQPALVTDQAWTSFGFTAPAIPIGGMGGSGGPGLPRMLWSLRAVSRCVQDAPAPASSVLVDDFVLAPIASPSIDWPRPKMDGFCTGVSEIGPAFSETEPPAFTTIHDWDFENGTTAPFSGSGGLSLSVSDVFPSNGAHGMQVSWNRASSSVLQLEVPTDDLVVGRYYGFVATARLAPGTPPRHWAYSNLPSAWQQQFSGVVPPTWFSFDVQYKGERPWYVDVAHFARISWCGTVEESPDLVFVDQAELRVSAVQEPGNYPTPSCPVITTTTRPTTTTAPTYVVPTTTTTTIRHENFPTTTTTKTTTTRPTTTTTSRLDQWPTTTTTTRPTTTTTSRLDQWPTTTNSPGSACSASYRVVSTWPGYVQAAVTVKATKPITSWSASFDLPPGAVAEQSWSAQVTQSGQRVTAKNYSWNGTLGSGSSAEFGLIVKGGTAAIPALTCTGS